MGKKPLQSGMNIQIALLHLSLDYFIQTQRIRGDTCKCISSYSSIIHSGLFFSFIPSIKNCFGMLSNNFDLGFSTGIHANIFSMVLTLPLF